MKRMAMITLSLLVLGGCAYGELKQVLRAQVASETNCGDVTVEPTPMYQVGHKDGQYRVKGCGVDRVYDCPKDSGLVAYGKKVCEYADSHAAPPAGATPPAADDPALAPPPDEEPSAEPGVDSEPLSDDGL